MAQTDVASFDVLRERSYPLILGVVAAVAVFIVSPDFFAYADGHNWKISELYYAGFEFSSIAASFLFTFYTFVVTAERGFIAKMRNSIYYAQLISYTLSAIGAGVLLAIASLPMMVLEPLPQSKWDLPTISIAAWTLVAVWATASFVRAVRIFVEFARVS